MSKNFNKLSTITLLFIATFSVLAATAIARMNGNPKMTHRGN